MTPWQNEFAKFWRDPAPGASKHLQLRMALLAAMERGDWAAGEKLPTETELTRLTPFSLGTVQRAIRSLVEDGLVVRRRGHGSFVTDQRSRMQNPLHFRFLADDGVGYLPVFPKVLSRRREARSGPWSHALGSDGRALLRIDRLFSINDEFHLYSRFYVDPERFDALARKPLKALHAANFSKLLADESNGPVSRLYQTARAVRLAAEMCRAMKVKQASPGLLLEIVGYAADGRAVYFQEIFIPPTERRLVMSDQAGAGAVVVPT